MVTVPRPPPMAEVKRQREKDGKAWRGIVSDPEGHMDRVHAQPLRHKAPEEPKLRPEQWRKRKRKDGTRPEGRTARNVLRMSDGRFAKLTKLMQIRNLKPTGSPR